MSLDFNLTECSDVHAITKDPEEWQVTQTIMFQMMHIGAVITKDNAKIVAKRIRMVEYAVGYFLYMPTKTPPHRTMPRPITLQDVKRRIGMRVNCCDVSEMEFDERIIRMLRDKAERELEHQTQKAEVAHG